MDSFNTKAVLWKKFFLLFFIIIPVTGWSDGACNFTAPKAIIDNWINRFDVPGKIITPLGESELSNEIGKLNSQKKHLGRFIFAGGRTLRFYIYAHKNDAKIVITQFKGGILNKIEEKLLFEAKKEGRDEKVLFYDFVLEDQAEFVLTFEMIGNKQGCAFMKWVEISIPGR
jgi:hypothetical protein